MSEPGKSAGPVNPDVEALKEYRERNKRRFEEEERRLHVEPREDVAGWLLDESLHGTEKDAAAAAEAEEAEQAGGEEEESTTKKFERLEDAFYLDIPQHTFRMMRYLVRLQDLLELALNPSVGWPLAETEADLESSRAEQIVTGSDPTRVPMFTIGQGEEYLWRLLARLRKVRSLRLREMNEYVLFGPHAKYNLGVAMFDVECKILLLLAEFPADSSRLVKLKVLERAEQLCEGLGLPPIGPPFSASSSMRSRPMRGWLVRMRQWELLELLRGLASAWNRLEYDIEALSCLLDGLQLVVADLVMRPQTDARMDGKPSLHRTALSTPEGEEGGGERLFRCTAEFIADVACTFASFWRSVHVAEVLSGEANAELDAREPIECLDMTPTRVPAGHVALYFSGSSVSGPWASAPVWEGYRVREADVNVSRWMTDQLSSANQQGFYDRLKGTLSLFSLRPGEKERHTRSTGNTEAQDPTAVLEYCRTPSQNDLFFSSFNFLGVSHMLKGMGGYAGLLRACTSLKVLDAWFDRVTNSRFLFWGNCVVMEKDFFGDLDQTLRGSDEPTLVQCMGEVNLLLRQERPLEEGQEGPADTYIQVYRTRRVERALLLWCILVVERRQCRMRRGDRIYRMDECRELLRTWCPESYAAKYQSATTAGARQPLGRRRRGPQRPDEEKSSDSDDDPMQLDATTALKKKLDSVREAHADAIAAHVATVDEFC